MFLAISIIFNEHVFNNDLIDSQPNSWLKSCVFFFLRSFMVQFAIYFRDRFSKNNNIVMIIKLYVLYYVAWRIYFTHDNHNNDF